MTIQESTIQESFDEPESREAIGTALAGLIYADLAAARLKVDLTIDASLLAAYAHGSHVAANVFLNVTQERLKKNS